MTNSIIPVFMAGGAGTRLWPLSRKSYPKQFLSFKETHSLFQDTFIRIEKMQIADKSCIITNKAYFHICQQQLKEQNSQSTTYILEPEGRNTAAAIAVASLVLQKSVSTKDPIILILPCDHIFFTPQQLYAAINRALPAVSEDNKIAVFGIKPHEANVGYGYIEYDKKDARGLYSIKKFIEKPPLAQAQQLYTSGRHHWNAGIFLFKASCMLKEIEQYIPETLELAKTTIANSTIKGQVLELNKDHFIKLPNQSIDHAVMEKTNNIVASSIDSKWSDLGSWSAVKDTFTTAKQDNYIKGNVYTEDSSNCLLYNTQGFTAALGLKDIIAVQTKDALLLANKSYSEKIKKLVDTLKTQKKEDLIDHCAIIRRPWGTFETLLHLPGFRVKHIIVYPEGKLSLQMHMKRSEHWIITRGIASVTCGDKLFTLKENQHTYIPVKTKHRLENLDNQELHLIEVQTGSYLEEDDIIRFDDIYGRKL
jgi:mannose-1-phosphate guanylyltransferase/mannose-6-phosphate isomerase